MTKETQELKINARKLQLEIDEKNEIINILKDELETTKEQSDKLQKENIKLLKDSKRVKFLQDENDFLQDKVGDVDKLEIELKKLKEKLAESEFLKLRITELEEDKTRAQDDSAKFEDRWKQAEQKLGKVLELESELHKWKTFGQDLEAEKNLIEAKLLESIEQETKFEDEVKRLSSIVRTHDEKLSQEQESISLIHDISVADVIEKQINEEDRKLKLKLDELEENLSELKTTNITLREELEGNKKIISDLRQDLISEKNLTAKLTKQLSSFTKQIKNLDKQYLPIHDQISSRSPPQVNLIGHDSGFQSINNDQLISPDQDRKTDTRIIASPRLVSEQKLTNGVKPTSPDDELRSASSEPADRLALGRFNQSTRIDQKPTDVGLSLVVVETQVDDEAPSVPNAVKQSTAKPTAETGKTDPNGGASEDGTPDRTAFSPPVSEKLQKTVDSRPHAIISTTGSQETLAKHPSAKSSAIIITNNNDDSGTNKSSTGEKSASISKQQSRGFVRNSLPSRSVNYGHSNTSAYLDRIRASVTATTTTNTTSSSVDEHISCGNLLARGDSEQYMALNCMLNHQHTSRCYVDSRTLQQWQKLYRNPDTTLTSQPARLDSRHHPHGHQHPIQSSRQVNALIDPISHEQLVMNLMQHQHHGQHPAHHQLNGVYEGELSDQQLAHLHQQHYYHHLHQIQTLHQMHHHFLHMKQRQQQANHHQSSQHPQAQAQASEHFGCVSPQVKQARDLIFSGGSQFYAPSAQLESQVYANANNHSDKNPEQQSMKGSPTKHPGLQHYSTLPQIDELKGLSCVRDRKCMQQQRISPNRHNVAQVIMTSEALAKQQHQQQQHQQSTNGIRTSASTSPTSSNSSPSNLSPSSASSTSSLNSLTIGGNQSKLVKSMRSSSNEPHFKTKRDMISSSSCSPQSQTATLSRVGSCRISNRPLVGNDVGRVLPISLAIQRDLNQSPQRLIESDSQRARQEPSSIKNSSPRSDHELMMTAPVRPNQSSMRTSKILNLGSPHSQAIISGYEQTHAVPPAPRPEQVSSISNRKRGMNRDQWLRMMSESPSSQLCNDLAGIKLNSSLAFSSLRAPKHSPRPLILDRSPNSSACQSNSASQGISKSNSENGTSSKGMVAKLSSTNVDFNANVKNGYVEQAPVAAVKPSSVKLTTRTSSSDQKQQVNGNGGNKSAVWFEYGCV